MPSLIDLQKVLWVILRQEKGLAYLVLAFLSNKLLEGAVMPHLVVGQFMVIDLIANLVVHNVISVLCGRGYMSSLLLGGS